jgi:hypothetical protein
MRRGVRPVHPLKLSPSWVLSGSNGRRIYLQPEAFVHHDEEVVPGFPQ